MPRLATHSSLLSIAPTPLAFARHRGVLHRIAMSEDGDGGSSVAEYRERLIDEVKKYPVLYDTQHEQHRDVEARDRCWREIAAGLHGAGGPEVIKRDWKVLRDSLRQSMRKKGPAQRRWRYHARMAFVLPYMTKRPQRYNKEIKLDVEPEPEPTAEDEGGDELELFFAAVCAGARRLPPNARARLQRHVLAALHAAQGLASPAPPTPPPPH